ncbi:MAG TPA: prephenate dehydrogenase/arogenate dehydrogenase family protein, partial [Bradyrhizobium sp.]
MVKLAIDKLVIFGVGLIGGSFALALKSAGAVRQVLGAGRNPANLGKALERGVIDGVAEPLPEALRGANLVLLAVPVGQTDGVMARIAPCLDGRTVVTDAGSTKRDVIAAARRHLASRSGCFVPAHPIAG